MEKVLSVPQSEVGIFHYKRKYPVYNFTIFDALRKKGYCYMWHLQIAKRGSIEVGSCLYLFLKEQRANNINKISFYSDGCAGQNKNRFVFALYLFAAAKFKMEITHRFFESGHSQNEGDSMHACIERALKNKVIYTPEQMYAIVANAKQTGEKYKLKEMQQSDFFNVKMLINGRNWHKDETGKKIAWTKIREIKVTHTEPGSLLFKYDYDDEYNKMDLTSQKPNIRPSRKRKFIPGVSSTSLTFDEEVCPAYTKPNPISKALYDDLSSLCRSHAIPEQYHTFFTGLINTNTETDINSDENDSEEDED